MHVHAPYMYVMFNILKKVNHWYVYIYFKTCCRGYLIYKRHFKKKPTDSIQKHVNIVFLIQSRVSIHNASINAIIFHLWAQWVDYTLLFKKTYLNLPKHRCTNLNREQKSKP